MAKIHVKKFKTLRDAEKAEMNGYARMKSRQRLELVQVLRETYFKLHPELGYARTKRLRRVIKIIRPV
ncbi:hypothetical protein LDC_0392 [sediment metagenome]|uniref:Uncharacterized protein n=1 Tax=sediment metagenome TaxID=749907 RepID=D9PFU7_9ZZZZ